MKAVRIALIFCFDEIYKGLPITAHLFNKIHITDNPSVCKPFHCILEVDYRGDLGEFAGESPLPKLLVYMFVGYVCFRFVSSREVRRPSACC